MTEPFYSLFYFPRKPMEQMTQSRDSFSSQSEPSCKPRENGKLAMATPSWKMAPPPVAATQVMSQVTHFPLTSSAASNLQKTTTTTTTSPSTSTPTQECALSLSDSFASQTNYYDWILEGSQGVAFISQERSSTFSSFQSDASGFDTIALGGGITFRQVSHHCTWWRDYI